MLILLALAISILLAVLRVWAPWRPRTEGVVLRRLRMPFAARLVRQAGALGLMVVVTLVNLVTRQVPDWLPAIPLAILLGSLLIPARYTITDRGVGIGALTFRRWTEFSGLSVRHGRIRLKSISGIRPLSIWLPGRFHDADVVAQIRRLIRGAYKGNSASGDTAQVGPASTEPEPLLSTC